MVVFKGSKSKEKFEVRLKGSSQAEGGDTFEPDVTDCYFI